MTGVVLGGGGCNNDRRNPDRYVIRSHVKDLQFHKVPSDSEKKHIWEKQISEGREEFNIGNSMRICLNHFVDAQPTNANPNPTLYLTESDTQKESPVMRKARTKVNPTHSNIIKAINMRYWKGDKQTKSETIGADPYLKPVEYNRPGPK